MNLQDSVLHRIADLDPARGHVPDVVRDDRLLAELLATPRDIGSSSRRLDRGPKAGAAVLAAAAAVAAVAGLVFALTASTSQTAYASWTPSGRELTTADLEALDLCDTAAYTPDQDGGIASVPVMPVVSEARGNYLYRVSVSDASPGESAYVECFVTLDGPTPDVAGSAAFASAPLEEVGPGALSIVQNGTASWSGDFEAGTSGGVLTSAFGQAGSDVRGVIVTTTSGRQVVATVGNGWWAAWVPESDPIQPIAEVILSSGEHVEVALAPAS